jgi:hypothetical protein
MSEIEGYGFGRVTDLLERLLAGTSAHGQMRPDPATLETLGLAA